MPATILDKENDVIGPYNRLSASQVNSFQSCPRLWFYEKNLHFHYNVGAVDLLIYSEIFI